MDYNGLNTALTAQYCNPIAYGSGNEIATGICYNKRQMSQKRVVMKYYGYLNQGQLRVVNPENTLRKPQPRQGSSDNGNLDNRAKKKIYKAIDRMGMRSEWLRMGTLTFGYNPSPDEARHILAQFIKSIKYDFKKKRKHFDYVWVLEIQPKRCMRTGEIVPHFHFVTSQWIDKTYLSNKWNKAVSKWQISKGYEPIEVNTRIDGARPTAKGYIVKDEKGNRYNLAKYLCKGNDYETTDEKMTFPIKGKLYSMDAKTSKEIQPTEELVIDSLPEFVNGISDTLDNLGIGYSKRKDYNENPILFSYNGYGVLNAVKSKTLPMRHDKDFYRKPIDAEPEYEMIIEPESEPENEYEMIIESDAEPDSEYEVVFESDPENELPEYEIVFEDEQCQPCFYFIEN